MGILSYITFDTIFIVVIFVVFVYFVITAKKKKYPYLGYKTTILKQKKSKRTKKKYKREEKCRQIFEKIFGKKFQSIRPDWLKNPITKRNLELDGYCKDIYTPLGKGLAFEHDGEQHSRYTKYFHDSPDQFLWQVKCDRWKDLQCKSRGILLIRIPHFIIENDLEEYIIEKLKRSGVKI